MAGVVSDSKAGYGQDDTRVDHAFKPTGLSQSSRHQRFVLSDPVAFSYLEEDPSTQVLERSRTLQGYQIYLVEQWACSRTHPTFIITAYTGDQSHSITVGILSVPADEESWSPRLRMYFKSLVQYHARRKDTPLGALMTTNLSGFPSSLTLIHIPGGDTSKHRQDFFVNEDLKRLGCSGRVGLTLAEPNAATRAKFHQLYRTSEKIDLYKAVVELVKLGQVALMLFGELEPEYADGLLCDVTEKAISGWWIDVGTDFYNVEPNDGMMGPTTVAALLGLLMGARNRLAAFGAPISKDVFDVRSTKRAIAHFQKSQGLARTRRLDRKTLDRLHKVTAKQASGDGWAVPKAVKSTVAELSGKGGEMVMDIVGARDKASLAEIETVSLDRFVQLVKGERAKWLWHGKARKRTTRDLFDTSGDTNQSQKDNTSSSPADMKVADMGQRRSGESQRQLPIEETPSTPPPPASQSEKFDSHDPSARRKTVLRRATGRIRNAVGKIDENPDDKDAGIYPGNNFSVESIQSQQTEPFPSPPPSASARTEFFRSDNAKLRPLPLNKNLINATPSFTSKLPETPALAQTNNYQTALTAQMSDKDHPLEVPIDLESMPTTATQSLAGDIVPVDLDLKDNLFPDDDRPAQNIGPLLRIRHSDPSLDFSLQDVGGDQKWPRHLSFSTVEDSILRRDFDEFSPRSLDFPNEKDGSILSAYASAVPQFPGERQDSDPLIDPLVSVSNPTPQSALRDVKLQALYTRDLRASLARLALTTAQPTAAHLETTRHNLEILSQDADQLSSLLEPRRHTFHDLEAQSRELVDEERAKLIEGIRELEMLGSRLDYEVVGLEGRVSDVEDAVREFERQVTYTEERVSFLTNDAGGHRRKRPPSYDADLRSKSQDRSGWYNWAKGLLSLDRGRSASHPKVRGTKAVTEGQ